MEVDEMTVSLEEYDLFMYRVAVAVSREECPFCNQMKVQDVHSFGEGLKMCNSRGVRRAVKKAFADWKHEVEALGLEKG